METEQETKSDTEEEKIKAEWEKMEKYWVSVLSYQHKSLSCSNVCKLKTWDKC